MLFSTFIYTDDQIIRANESEFDFLERFVWPSDGMVCLNNRRIISVNHDAYMTKNLNKCRYPSSLNYSVRNLFNDLNCCIDVIILF